MCTHTHSRTHKGANDWQLPSLSKISTDKRTGKKIVRMSKQTNRILIFVCLKFFFVYVFQISLPSGADLFRLMEKLNQRIKRILYDPLLKSCRSQIPRQNLLEQKLRGFLSLVFQSGDEIKILLKTIAPMAPLMRIIRFQNWFASVPPWLSAATRGDSSKMVNKRNKRRWIKIRRKKKLSVYIYLSLERKYPLVYIFDCYRSLYIAIRASALPRHSSVYTEII